MSWKCACGQPCDSVSKALLRTLRTAYLDLGGEHVQSEHLIQLRALVDSSTGQDRYPLGLDTGFVCRATFLHCLGISETELAGAAVLHKGGTQFVAQAQEREALKHTHAEACQTKFVLQECDNLPSGGSHLPQCIGWRDLHNMYTLESKPGEAASKSVFDAARHERFPHLHLAKDTNFARCKVCCNLKEQRLRLTGKSPDDVAAVFAKIHAHLRLQRLQRKCERVAEEQAVSHPGEQAMIYADQTAAKAIPSPWCERAFRLPVAMGGTLSRSTNTGALFVTLAASERWTRY